MTYFFILGNHPDLSKAEIKTKLNQLQIEFEIESDANDFLILNIKQEIESSFLIKQLAGTIKIGEIIREISKPTPEMLAKELPESDTKMCFGISPYNYHFDVQKTGLQLKKLLKQNNVKARFVSSKTYPLSSVIVQKNLIAKGGIELVIIKADKQIFLGKTLAVQPFELFSKLDFGRPARDDFSGMIPPKLAQIMINLSGTNFNQAILDPFCGSGTILQQAIFLGHKNITGTDASKKAITDSKENLAWLSSIGYKNNCKVWQQDIQNLTQKVTPNSINAIVTEPYLGPPIRGNESENQLEHIMRELKKLYRAAFKSMSTVLKQSGTIIIVIPSIKIKGKFYTIDMQDLLPQDLELDMSWQYSRSNQFIVRNICKVKKAKED
ncbi:methyltransferase domain-containing protein [Candidatus Kuenenbacteria bacterium]|nr:methyltransferase domain-containing protein [Candidatus Kuenenbacteria bacterium]